MSSATQTLGWTVLIGILVVSGCSAMLPDNDPPLPYAPCLEVPWRVTCSAERADHERSGNTMATTSAVAECWQDRYARYYRRTFVAIEEHVYRIVWSVAEQFQ